MHQLCTTHVQDRNLKFLSLVLNIPYEWTFFKIQQPHYQKLLFSRVLDNHAKTCMNESNLGTVFGPTLMASSDPSSVGIRQRETVSHALPHQEVIWKRSKDESEVHKFLAGASYVMHREVFFPLSFFRTNLAYFHGWQTKVYSHIDSQSFEILEDFY